MRRSFLLLPLTFAYVDAARISVDLASLKEDKVDANVTEIRTESDGGPPASHGGCSSFFDVTQAVSGAVSAGRALCCCDDPKLPAAGERGRFTPGLCVVVRGFDACGDLPPTSWASRKLLPFTTVGGRCCVSQTDAPTVMQRYSDPTADNLEYTHLYKVGPGFWNVRGSFFLYGIEDFGSHMSIAQMSDGNFVAIDTLDPSIPGLKAEIDRLTDNGKKLTMVLGTHPFHTLFFPAFHAAYPSSKTRQYFGTPRHVRKFPEIFAGNDISSLGETQRGRPFPVSAFRGFESLEMLIPNGGEWDFPVPEEENHLMNVFVYHKPSKTVHTDDTVMVINPNVINWKKWALSTFLKELRPGMHFHPSLTGPGLYPRSVAPSQFKASMLQILGWDFENVCSAHMGNSLGDAKRQMQQLIAETEETFRQLSAVYAKNENLGKKPGKK